MPGQICNGFSRLVWEGKYHCSDELGHGQGYDSESRAAFLALPFMIFPTAKVYRIALAKEESGRSLVLEFFSKQCKVKLGVVLDEGEKAMLRSLRVSPKRKRAASE